MKWLNAIRRGWTIGKHPEHLTFIGQVPDTNRWRIVTRTGDIVDLPERDYDQLRHIAHLRRNP